MNRTSISKISKSELRRLQGREYVGIVTCFFCYNSKGEIFMARRSKQARDEQGVWDVGGGALELGFTAEENVQKEIMEEYGAAAQKMCLLGYRDVMRNFDQSLSHWMALDFAVLVNEAEVRINEPHKFDDSGWFAMNQLPQPLHSQVGEAFKKYSDQLKQII